MKITYGRFKTADGVDIRPAELVAAEVRAQRARLIAESDWVVLPDVSMSDETKAAWISYRQALRDITTQPEFPFGTVFPTPPG